MIIDIFIPTIRSEDKIRQTLDSLNATIIPSGITLNTHIIRTGNSYAEAINETFKKTNGEWFFCGADDLRFEPDWLEKLIPHMKDYDVLGTNDLHHPAVLEGKYATHFLVSRKYIDEHGGTFTGDKGFVYYSYKHNFTDTELVYKAMVLRRFIAVKDSVVEHCHPTWGRGQMDEGYKKSLDTMADDQTVFNKRLMDFSKKDVK